MSTLTAKSSKQVSAKRVAFAGNVLRVELSEGREVCLPLAEIPWLKWLAKATPNGMLEPGGDAIYWEDLDDGIEVCRLLGGQAIA